MLAQQVKIRGEPTADPQKCRFVLDGEVLSRASISFTRESDTEKAPLAKQLLDLPYRSQVNIAGQVVTLTGDNVESCPASGKEIGEEVCKYADPTGIVLLRNHGVFTIGTSAKSAMKKAKY